MNVYCEERTSGSGNPASDAIDETGEVDCFAFAPDSNGVYAVNVNHHTASGAIDYGCSSISPGHAADADWYRLSPYGIRLRAHSPVDSPGIAGPSNNPLTIDDNGVIIFTR